ncbi:VWA domain-containing protein [Clostridium tagluense]|uniref:VWA domain-containing protein n=1 Tax=Clostridium tagluense TaxID=360422 RepID=UPI001CF10FB0|nr:VWA domain-containing protein [Clostridium tagluense]MCB2313383.1 VWA domain-containing protein [Clostridium tagluense]MCB2318207.1 VWA domain-containing protein [Clostridium tagluense]MCB2322967.1 VWA domain-containing protein [Clostridium tagluense]MCB2327991.1 VWA domain-containing protein [Clostridium tagluense]MCB2332669.1 VWA domain-containing protein [Clostridium tagluense]
MSKDISTLNRWRLILGKYSSNNLSFSEDYINYADMDTLLEFLYEREYGEERGIRNDKRGGSLNPSNLTVPQWITKIKELFPKETVEILEKHALEKYNLKELLTDKTVLEKLEPNPELLKSILQMKHLMKGEVLETAKKIVKVTAEEIAKKLEQDIKTAINGRLDRNKYGGIKSSRNIDFKRTIKQNLKNFNRELNTLVVDRVYFNKRVKSSNPWNVIIAVDESGSMLDSVIHSAIMAGIFSKLPMLKTNLVIFDTEIVDLTEYLDDVVQTLMSIQLGGGTNISRALQYCNGLMENPHKTIVILVTDLYEGGNYGNMYARAKDIIESGAKLIILPALGIDAEPVYDRGVAKKMVALGANVAAITPGGLAKWIAQIIS